MKSRRVLESGVRFLGATARHVVVTSEVLNFELKFIFSD